MKTLLLLPLRTPVREGQRWRCCSAGRRRGTAAAGAMYSCTKHVRTAQPRLCMHDTQDLPSELSHSVSPLRTRLLCLELLPRSHR